MKYVMIIIIIAGQIAYVGPEPSVLSVMGTYRLFY